LNKKKQDNIISFSMPPAMQQKLKKIQEKKGFKYLSAYIRDLINKYVNDDEDVIAVTLKIPNQLRGNQEGLEAWFAKKIPTVINALSAEDKSVVTEG
jgi:predicted DNA-binding protein